jgi:hypothetical protein
MEKKIVYKCDPDKNTKCNKLGCKYNKDAKYPVCDLTNNIDHSIDRIPMEVIRTDKGFIYQPMNQTF